MLGLKLIDVSKRGPRCFRSLPNTLAMSLPMREDLTYVMFFPIGLDSVLLDLGLKLGH